MENLEALDESCPGCGAPIVLEWPAGPAEAVATCDCGRAAVLVGGLAA